MRVRPRSSSDRPGLSALSSTLPDEIDPHPPIPKAPLRTAVSDGSIVLFVQGDLLDRPAVGRLKAELDLAMAVCRGIVTVDLSGCTALGKEAARILQGHHEAARAPEARCRFRIVAGSPSTIRALAAGTMLAPPESRRHPGRTGQKALSLHSGLA